MDKKFGVAILIIAVLAIALLYVTFIGPSISGYVEDKRIQGQTETVQAILQIVEQQGYVAIGEGEDAVVLVKYQPQENITTNE